MTKRLVLAALAGVGLLLAGASFLPRQPLLVWNFTASAPVGLYRALPRYALEQEGIRGVWVAVAPGAAARDLLARLGILEPGRLLVKRVAAAAGDEVCRKGFVVTINGAEWATARATTSTGMPLPAWSGCRTLKDGEVFLLGQTDGSFDGRYFGVTRLGEVVAPLELLIEISRPAT